MDSNNDIVQIPKNGAEIIDTGSDNDLPDLVHNDDTLVLPVLPDLLSTDTNKTLDEKKETRVIAGTSHVKSSMDEKGNISISVTYDSNCYSCCVCFERIIGPIISCDSMHSLCHDCCNGLANENDNRCPVCRSCEKGRNYLLENAIDKFHAHCTNNGCLHKDYIENMEEHKSKCVYTEIKCPWCKECTTVFDLQTHTEFECADTFSVMNCSDRIDFIKSKKFKNILIVSVVDDSRIMYITKSENECSLMCIQTKNTDSMSCITMSYNIRAKSIDNMKLTESRKIMIPIHKPENLIKGQILMHTIPMEILTLKEDITITGFDDKFKMHSKWMVMDMNHEWHPAEVGKRLYNPDRVLIVFVNDKHAECITLNNGESERIRPLDIASMRYSFMENRYVQNRREDIQNMDEDEQLRLIMEMSMDDQ